MEDFKRDDGNYVKNLVAIHDAATKKLRKTLRPAISVTLRRYAPASLNVSRAVQNILEVFNIPSEMAERADANRPTALMQRVFAGRGIENRDIVERMMSYVDNSYDAVDPGWSTRPGVIDLTKYDEPPVIDLTEDRTPRPDKKRKLESRATELSAADVIGDALHYDSEPAAVPSPVLALRRKK